MNRTRSEFRFWALMVLFVAVHFAIRPLVGSRHGPDLVLVALVFYAMRSRPGAGAVAGLLVGLATDALAPTAFGSAALAHTCVGYAAGRLKAFVVADNAAMTALFVLAAAWLRDVIQVISANQLAGSSLAWQLLATSPVAAAATAVTALVALFLFHGWLAAPRSQ